jgi:hypothetical protein
MKKTVAGTKHKAPEKEEGHQAPKPKKTAAAAKPTKNPLDCAKMAFFWV